MRVLASCIFMAVLSLISFDASAAELHSSSPIRATQLRQNGCYNLDHPTTPGRVCVHLVDRKQNPDVLYFFHGVDRQAEDWQDRPEFQALRDLWSKSPRGLPTVVSLSFGPRWFLKARDGNDPGRHDAVVRELLPRIEGVLGGLGSGRRMILGESMGGANAALLFIREQQLFNRVALLCPAFSTVSPFSVFDIGKYIWRNKADGVLTWYFMGVARELIGRPEAWNPNNPLDMVTHMVGPQTPAMYVSSSEHDEFGFFEGGNQFANVARDRKASVRWFPRQARHCANHDLPSIVEFFQ